MGVLSPSFAMLVEVIIRLRVQFGVKVSKFNEPAGRVKFNFVKNSQVQFNFKLNEKVV